MDSTTAMNSVSLMAFDIQVESAMKNCRTFVCLYPLRTIWPRNRPTICQPKSIWVGDCQKVFSEQVKPLDLYSLRSFQLQSQSNIPPRVESRERYLFLSLSVTYPWLSCSSSWRFSARRKSKTSRTAWQLRLRFYLLAQKVLVFKHDIVVSVPVRAELVATGD